MVARRRILPSHSHLQNTPPRSCRQSLTSIFSSSQNHPCTDPGTYPGTLDHYLFRHASVTLRSTSTTDVGLVVEQWHSPATAFVTTPPCFRFHPSPESVNGSKSIRIKAIAHFVSLSLSSHLTLFSHPILLLYLVLFLFRPLLYSTCTVSCPSRHQPNFET